MMKNIKEALAFFGNMPLQFLRCDIKKAQKNYKILEKAINELELYRELFKGLNLQTELYDYDDFDGIHTYEILVSNNDDINGFSINDYEMCYLYKKIKEMENKDV